MPERIKSEETEKFVANLNDKEEYLIHIRNWKQALNHGLVLKKKHSVIKFNQKACLNLYIHINTEQKYCKKWFQKIFFAAN